MPFKFLGTYARCLRERGEKFLFVIIVEMCRIVQHEKGFVIFNMEFELNNSINSV